MNRHKSIRGATTWLVYRIVFISVGGIGVLSLLLYKILDSSGASVQHPLLFIVCMLAACIAAGVVLTIPLSRHFLKPLAELVAATDAVASGDYSVRVPEETAIGEFRHFIHSFNKMAESLDGMEIMRTDFINTISHEFKTPVVSIRGFARLLQNPDLTDEQRKRYTDTILIESEKLSTMSSNILLLSQYETMQVLPGRLPYSLDEQLRECIRQQQRAWLKKNITIVGDLETVTYEGNEDMMIHLWSNLLSNAIKFTPEGGTITVSLFARDGAIRVSFRDTGIGMDEQTLAHIYEKFWQADASRRREGNGLGLAIARRIVRLAGGRIDAVSRPGEGSEFTVTLPTA